jgi:hypothetical protein
MLFGEEPIRARVTPDMATLRYLHQLMNERRMVQLSDGRIGKIVRVDTLFPGNATTVTVWTESAGPSVSKVSLADVIGEAEKQSA